ncbi:Cof-type HAD-IIB family hydrolase [Haloplasma contractile]|uniref:3-deoxy-D-manno-octulosonate 8-phosphate phosphatase KDO 8-P phosphatase protein n=1 Tax=Haloplasma contractile SSD-17B TaxID=1033810 RepID=U2EBK9_9MOLU|nr:Cof-type HAD-IIB family hydrolase [Haloplasma contractile]ERJ12458.1 3-deoxy-D-manno-octulosonate 8-phosphate phosphatase KDO 8-P phosphatase protein [Haloplasma contractile SSD-17B]
MKVKHIFCDLDGTLLQEYCKLNSDDLTSIKEAEKEGIKVSIATGRLDYEIKKINNRVKINGYRISQNGAVVHNHDNQLIHMKSLTEEEIKQIVTKLSHLKVLVFFESRDAYYCIEKLKIIEDFEKSQDLLTYIERPNILNELHELEISSISIWAEKHENKNVQKSLEKMLPEHLTTYISSDYTLDITNVENSKGNAIRRICKHDDLDINEIAVIGDSYNDISMFNVTKHSYVIDKASNSVRKHANHTVKSVSEAIKHILENN